MSSKFFTHLCQLSILNEGISKEYVSELQKTIEVNRLSVENYEESVTFQEVFSQFGYYKNFLKSIKILSDENKEQTMAKDVRLMEAEMLRIKMISDCKTKTV